jgi:hypothetical protein
MFRCCLFMIVSGLPLCTDFVDDGPAEKALMSLPSPLTASDEWLKPRDTTLEIIRVTAGLHRQVWVSGTSIYVDVHVANNSRKTIKKIELQLERDILCYKHVCCRIKTYIRALLMMDDTRQLHLQWRSQQARLVYLTAMKSLFSAKPSSNKVLPGGTEYLPITHMSAHATSKYRADMPQ